MGMTSEESADDAAVFALVRGWEKAKSKTNFGSQHATGSLVILMKIHLFPLLSSLGDRHSSEGLCSWRWKLFLVQVGERGKGEKVGREMTIICCLLFGSLI
jgi:hypothetical protein